MKVEFTADKEFPLPEGDNQTVRRTRPGEVIHANVTDARKWKEKGWGDFEEPKAEHRAATKSTAKSDKE